MPEGRDMHKTRAVSQRVILVLLVINLVLTAGIIAAFIYHGRFFEAAHQKYTLYIGLNDRDTYSQKISTSDARQIVDEICARHTDGYTSFNGAGGWVDSSGVLTQEETLVYMFYDIDENHLTQIMDEALDALNQSSILVEKDQAAYTYYSGKHDESR